MKPSANDGDLEFFELMSRHMPRMFVSVMRHLPSDPRCRLCRAPYGGIGGRVMRRFGYGPSRKNPTLCATCFEKAPLGGVEMEIGVFFADVRGFTSMAEEMDPTGVAGLLNRFYESASAILGRSAIIDKLVGDEVMGLFLTSFPTLAGGARACGVMVGSARELLARLDPLPVGVGLHYGVARVGNVGDGAVKDFTAVGDVVNTASRLQACAGPGEIVMSDEVFERVSESYADARPASLTLKGKSEPVAAHVL